MNPLLRGTTLILFLAAGSLGSSGPSQAEGGSFDTTDPKPARLNAVTLGHTIRWAALQIIAPERLNAIVPVYIYNRRDLNNTNLETAAPCLKLATEQSPAPGTICVYGQPQTINTVNGAGAPDSGGYQLKWRTGQESDGAQPGIIALNHRVPGRRPQSTVWMTYDDWSDAVSHYSAPSSP